MRARPSSLLTVMVAVALLCVILVWCNRGNVVTIWFFREYKDLNVLWLMASTASASIIVWRILSATTGVLKDMRELRRQDELRKHEEAQRELSRKLAEHEQRLGRTDESAQT